MFIDLEEIPRRKFLNFVFFESETLIVGWTAKTSDNASKHDQILVLLYGFFSHFDEKPLLSAIKVPFIPFRTVPTPVQQSLTNFTFIGFTARVPQLGQCVASLGTSFPHQTQAGKIINPECTALRCSILTQTLHAQASLCLLEQS